LDPLQALRVDVNRPFQRGKSSIRAGCRVAWWRLWMASKCSPVSAAIARVAGSAASPARTKLAARTKRSSTTTGLSAAR
jgi:hypothetical protein